MNNRAIRFSQLRSDASVPVKSRTLTPVRPQQLQEAAKRIRGFYLKLGIRLHPDSAVGKVVVCAENIRHENGRYLETTVSNVFDGFSVLDLSEMLSVLEGHPRAKECLNLLTEGSLSTYCAGWSRSKDLLWELMVCSRMRKVGLSAELAEPPDILWKDGDKVTGIACKKIYSDSKVQSVFSKGVDQLSRAGEYGILAINIDEYLPHDKTLQVQRAEGAEDWPYRIIRDFSIRHSRHSDKYLESGRLSGIVIGISCRTTLVRQSGQHGFFMNVLWDARTSPGLPWEHQRRLFRMARRLERMPEYEQTSPK